MGTKNQPGKFDCYAHAEPDEPMFVLLGRDPTANLLVRLWASLRAAMGTEPDKLEEAFACADALEAWARKLEKGDKVEEAKQIFLRQMVEMIKECSTE